MNNNSDQIIVQVMKLIEEKLIGILVDLYNSLYSMIILINPQVLVKIYIYSTAQKTECKKMSRPSNTQFNELYTQDIPENQSQNNT